MMSSISAIALTGTIGAGKTTLAEAISAELHERGIRHALLDLDWLGQVYPVPEGHRPYGYELALHNLQQVWPNFVAAGARKAVIAGTILDEDQKQRLHDALGKVALSVVLVQASQQTLETRIKARNSGLLRKDFLARTALVAHEIEAAGIHDFLVKNDGVAPRELAERVLVMIDWI